MTSVLVVDDQELVRAGLCTVLERQDGIEVVGEAAGLHVDAAITEPAQPMSAGVELAAYRLVQEALTNALRHGDGRVRLRIEPAPGALVVRTSNKRATRAPAVSGSGHGLAGMRERVRLFGGELEAGWQGEHFELTARLPLEPVGA